jgi:hypothetical protein
MIKRIQVIKVDFKNAPSQYCVRAVIRPAMEDNFEMIDHPALFRDAKSAEVFAKKIDMADKKAYPKCGINLSQWICPTSEASYVRNDINPSRYSII